MKKLIVFVLVASMLSGCAPVPYRPIVDTGTPKGDYNADSEDCRGIASNVRVGDTVGGGAVIGAVFGALLGAAVGLKGDNLRQVAAAGAVSGGAQGLAYGSGEWMQVFNNCMRGRGYNVLN
jgi:outer membrane lipoprotein SlyB